MNARALRSQTARALSGLLHLTPTHALRVAVEMPTATCHALCQAVGLPREAAQPIMLRLIRAARGEQATQRLLERLPGFLRALELADEEQAAISARLNLHEPKDD